MAQYKVLGIEGNKVEVNGVEYDGGVGAVVELTPEEAAQPLAESKVELVEGQAAEAASTASSEESSSEESDEESEDSEESEGSEGGSEEGAEVV